LPVGLCHRAACRLRHTRLQQCPDCRASLPPKSPDIPRRLFRSSRARCSPEPSASPGRSPSSCRRAPRPRSPLALPLGGVSRRVVRHRGATHEEVGFASLDARLPS
jgi:hypothetical protein